MTTTTLLYVAYIVWLVAGSADFLCHRRSDLAHTSGVKESALHLVQLALLGCAVVMAMGIAPGIALAMVLVSLVVAHGIVGYLDSRAAFTAGRVVVPIEQHIHSVLDMAPLIALGIWLVGSSAELIRGDWRFESRHSGLSIGGWASVTGPALVLCVFPGLMEFRTAWKARHLHSDGAH